MYQMISISPFYKRCTYLPGQKRIWFSAKCNILKYRNGCVFTWFLCVHVFMHVHIFSNVLICGNEILKYEEEHPWWKWFWIGVVKKWQNLVCSKEWLSFAIVKSILSICSMPYLLILTFSHMSVNLFVFHLQLWCSGEFLANKDRIGTLHI